VAGAAGRLAIRGRHVDELTNGLRRGMREAVARRDRAYRERRLQLESGDPRRRLAAARTRLVGDEARLASSIARRRHGLDAALRTAAARLESLSPLAVLGRGYAVCWDGDRTRTIRDAATLREGDRVAVTLQRGEIDCAVVERRRAVDPDH
jgi:exodeoxyribonuclease VII large subunit